MQDAPEPIMVGRAEKSMTLRNQFLVTVLAGFLFAVLGLNWISQESLSRGFMELEAARAKEDLRRIEAAADGIADNLSKQSSDWANWDDTYQYLQDRNVAYETSNLAEGSLKETGLDAVAFITTSGDILRWAQIHGDQNSPSSQAQLWPVLQNLGAFTQAQAGGRQDVHGFVETAAGIAVVSIRPVHRSDLSGPSRGWVIFVQEFSSKLIAQIGNSVRLKIEAAPLSASQGVEPQVVLNQVQVKGWTAIRDIRGKPILRLNADLSNAIVTKGHSVVTWMNLQLLGVTGLFATLISFAIVRQVIRPIETIQNQLKSAENSDPSRFKIVRACKEIADLSFGLREMLIRIDEQKQRLLESEEELRAHNENLESLVEARTAEIEHQAHHDRLTNLPNRWLFGNRVQHAAKLGHRTGKMLAVMFIDLDNFKYVNDTLGHAIGDQLLIEVAARMKSAVREGDTVARLGGDEFTILMESLDSEREAAEVAGQVLRNLAKPFMLEGQECFVGASIGIALSNAIAMDAEQLMKNADLAMYHAKRDGKRRFTFFSADMEKEVCDRLLIENALRKAVSENQIEVHYQPIVDLQTGQLMGCEALSRWDHPELGRISPSTFIPIAEETGLIVQLGHQTLLTACMQAQIFREELCCPDFVMSVNLSGRQFQSPKLVDSVRNILAETGLPPHCLKLELTESMLMTNREQSIDQMKQLSALGIALALDDFGTGFSSLSTLHSFPIETLKIDQSFIARLSEGEDARAIIQAIIGMAKTLKINVTSEGIESQEQETVVRELGSQLGQGYLYDRPLRAEALIQRFAPSQQKRAA